MDTKQRLFWGGIYALHVGLCVLALPWWGAVPTAACVAWLFWPTFWRKPKEKTAPKTDEDFLLRSIQVSDAYYGTRRVAMRPPAYNTTPPLRRKQEDMSEEGLAVAIDLLGTAVDALITTESTPDSSYTGDGGTFGGAGASGDWGGSDNTTSADTSYDSGSSGGDSGGGFDGGSSGGDV